MYKKVDTGREGDRVFLLEIAGNRRFFFWMQDKSADKDEVITYMKQAGRVRVHSGVGLGFGLRVARHQGEVLRPCAASLFLVLRILYRMNLRNPFNFRICWMRTALHPTHRHVPGINLAY